MSASSELLDQALALPAEQRAEIVRRLLLSLEESGLEDPAEVEKAWAEEIDARLDRVDAGDSKETDWRVAVKRVRKGMGLEG